jgi:hypothetical protein
MPTAPVARNCPTCGASCPARAKICHSCKKVLPDLDAFAFDAAEVARVRAAVETGEMPHTTPILEQPRKLRPATMIWFGVLCICIAAPGLTWHASEALSGLFITVGAMALIVFTIMGLVDLVTPGPRGRRTPEQAVQCYFKNLRRRRYPAAFASLSPLAYDRPVRVPDIPKLRSVPEEMTLSDPAQLKRYWKSLAHMSGGRLRRISKLDITRTGGDDTLARFTVRLRLSAYPSWILIIGGAILAAILEEHVEAQFEVLVHPHHAQYWVYGGELGHRAG